MAIPTGINESSRHPSPFCSMTVPRRGTSTGYRGLEADMRTIAVPCFGRKEATLGHFFKGFKSGVVTEGRDVLFDDEA